MRIHRLLPILVACLIALHGASALADDLVISSGKAGGYYEAVAKRMQVIITTNLGATATVENSEGSTHNLSRLDDAEDPVSLAFSQEDALEEFVDAHPGFEQKYVVLTDIGSECAFMIAQRESDIRSSADLQVDADRTVAVGDGRSGAAVTYERLSQLDPRFRKAPAEERDIIESLLDLKAENRRTKVAAALVMQRPLAISVPVEIAMEHPSVYRFVPIRRADLNISDEALEASGYTFERVTVGFGRDYRRSFETICTRGLILASKPKLGDEMLARIAQVFSESISYIAPRR